MNVGGEGMEEEMDTDFPLPSGGLRSWEWVGVDFSGSVNWGTKPSDLALGDQERKERRYLEIPGDFQLVPHAGHQQRLFRLIHQPHLDLSTPLPSLVRRFDGSGETAGFPKRFDGEGANLEPVLDIPDAFLVRGHQSDLAFEGGSRTVDVVGRKPDLKEGLGERMGGGLGVGTEGGHG